MSQLKLPITVGIYRTRGGDLAFVEEICRSDIDQPYPVRGRCDGVPESWTPEGSNYQNIPAAEDLVERVLVVPDPSGGGSPEEQFEALRVEMLGRIESIDKSVKWSESEPEWWHRMMSVRYALNDAQPGGRK